MSRIFFLSALILSLVVPIWAQDNQIKHKLDAVIREQRSIIRKLKKLEMWEIDRELERLQKNLRALREIKRMLSQQQKASGGGAAIEANKLKENIRKLYSTLSEIPIATQQTKWKEAQKSWFIIQRQNPEYMGKSEIAFYKNQLQNLSQKFQEIEHRAHQEYKNILDKTDILYLRLQEDSWLAVSPRWKILSRSWEKSRERYGENDLSRANRFKELSLGFQEIERETKERKNKAHERIRTLYREIDAMYRSLSEVSLAKRQKRWGEYERTWYSIGDTRWQDLAPKEAKKFELELVSLRNLLSSYQFELLQQMEKIFQRAQEIQGPLQSDKWAQNMEIYPDVMNRWRMNWQNQVNLSLKRVGDLENILGALERLQKSARQQYKELHTQISALKTNIDTLSALMSRNTLITEKPQWMQLQSRWQELRYIRIENAAPKFSARYCERLKALHCDLQNMDTLARRELSSKWQTTQDLYRALAGNNWSRTFEQWKEIEGRWKTDWAWKKEVAFSDIRKLETILRQMQTAYAKIKRQKQYNIKEAHKLLKNLEKLHCQVAPMGKNDKRWNQIELAWENLQRTEVDSLSPEEMKQYFTKGRELRKMLEGAQSDLHAYCVELLQKTEQLHSRLVKNPWSEQVKQVEKLSRQWVVKRPLTSRVSIAQGPQLESFYEKFSEIYERVQQARQQRLEKVDARRKRLNDRCRLVQSNSLFTGQERWLDWKFELERCLDENYTIYDARRLGSYERRLELLENDLEVLEEGALENLRTRWSKTRKLYQSLRQNPWTSYLLHKNRLQRAWEKSWADKKFVALQDSESLFQIEEKLERCRPFWWRPLPPQGEIPKNSFIRDIFEVNVEGTPFVPQWSLNGSLLVFQSVHGENWAIQLLNLASGQIEIIELYDPLQRWVAYPALAPRPHAGKIAFSGKKLGFYDLYQVNCSKNQSPQPLPITDTPEAEKIPRWCLLDGRLYLFFLTGKDIYCRGQDGKISLVLKSVDYKFHEITDFAICAGAKGKSFRLALCVRPTAEPDSFVYCARIVPEQKRIQAKEIHRVSELGGKYFAPVWSYGGRWLLCYREDRLNKVHLLRINTESGRTRQLSGEGAILIPPVAEMRFKGVEITGNPPAALYFRKKKNCAYPVLTLTSLDNPQDSRELSSDKYRDFFNESAQLTLSPDGNFLAWTYLKEGQGRKLVIAVVDFSALNDK